MTTPITLAIQAADAAAAALEEATEELCRLDSVAGDGDHGFAMATAAKAIRRRLQSEPPADLRTLFEIASTEFGAVGGSMGALLSVFYDTLAEEDSGETTSPGTRAAERLGKACAELTEFGGAKPGDKTIVDAASAAATAATDRAAGGAEVPDVLRAAADGARAGADSTADMIATIGRASRLGERSRGSVDAGARSFAIVLTAVADTYTTGENA
jgi:dihydroxyacetone kinase